MRSLLLIAILLVTAVPGSAQAPAAPAAALDYELFKSQVQPIFLAKLDGFARCYTCHSQGTPFRLQRLTEGATAWNEEQSKLNFAAVQKVAIAGNLESRLLRMPLSHDSGGTEFHPGGKRWASKSDREFQTLAKWIGVK